MSEQSTSGDPMADFGPNEWLIDELYQQYLTDKRSVDKAWWEFFRDYEPRDVTLPDGNENGNESSAKKAPAANGSGGASTPGHMPKVAPAPPRVTSSHTAPSTDAASSKPAPEKPPSKTPTKPSADTATKRADAAEPAKASAAAPEAPTPTPRDIPAVKETGPVNEDAVTPLRGAPSRVVANMEVSLTVPTATSVRAVPAKLLIDNRVVINNHLARSRGGKVSFTHIIGYAMVKALGLMPAMNNGFVEQDGKPALLEPAHVNFGLAIDLQKPDGSRTLVVPSIKSAEEMDFVHFWTAYEDMVKKARDNKLTVADFQGTTISLTNPGGIGTVHSVPRLMKGQGTIIGVGALDYPAEWQGASNETLNRNAVSKILTLTSTYDHRIIQGAQSGTSCGSSTSCCSARTASSTRSSSRCGSPTSRSAGSRTSTPRTMTTSTRSPASRS